MHRGIEQERAKVSEPAKCKARRNCSHPVLTARRRVSSMSSQRSREGKKEPSAGALPLDGSMGHRQKTRGPKSNLELEPKAGVRVRSKPIQRGQFNEVQANLTSRPKGASKPGDFLRSTGEGS